MQKGPPLAVFAIDRPSLARAMRRRRRKGLPEPLGGWQQKGQELHPGLARRPTRFLRMAVNVSTRFVEELGSWKQTAVKNQKISKTLKLFFPVRPK